jgi:hypothetical protein
MHAPNRDQLQAVVELSRLPQWKRINEILEAEYQATAEKLVGALDVVATRKLQGRAKMLKDLQELVASAPTLLEKLRR